MIIIASELYQRFAKGIIFSLGEASSIKEVMKVAASKVRDTRCNNNDGCIILFQELSLGINDR